MSTHIFCEGTLNLFCDASISKGARIDGCSGSVPVVYSEESDEGVQLKPQVAVIRNCTNNIAELMAINLGVNFALKNQELYTRINLFSDSQISIFGLRDWIWAWARSLRTYNRMISSAGTDVANQEIIMTIVNKINSIKTPFYLYHQKGHAVGKCANARKVFTASNNILLAPNDVVAITKYNDFIDRYTRDLLLSRTYMESDVTVPLPFCIRPDMRAYYEVMRKSRGC